MRFLLLLPVVLLRSLPSRVAAMPGCCADVAGLGCWVAGPPLPGCLADARAVALVMLLLLFS